MWKLRTGSRIALFVLVAAFATTAGAAKSPKPVGKVSIESTSIAAGIGVSWGDGQLLFHGKAYHFAIEGLTLVDIGISKASAVGDVYDLKDVGQFEGIYVAGEAGFALAGGMGGMALRNQNGMIMHLRSVTQGAKLHAAGSQRLDPQAEAIEAGQSGGVAEITSRFSCKRSGDKIISPRKSSAFTI